MKRNRVNTLQNRVTIYFVLVTLLVLVLPGFLFYHTARSYLVTELAGRLNLLATVTAGQFEGEAVARLAPGDENTQLYQVLRARLQRLREQADAEDLCLFGLDHRVRLDAGDIPTGQDYFIARQDADEIENVVRQGTSQASHLYTGTDGRFYMAAYAPVRDADGKVVALLRLEGSPLVIGEVLEGYRDKMLLFAAVALFLTLLLARFLTGYVLGPVQELVGGVQRLGGAEWTPVPVRRADELGFLAGEFNRMAEAIRRSEAELKELHQAASTRARTMELYNEYILQNIRSGILTCRLDGRVTVVNKALRRMLDLEHEPADRPYPEVLLDYPPFIAMLEETIQRQRNQAHHDVAVRDPRTGRERSFDCLTSLLLDDENRVLGVIFTVAETTRLKELQDEIEVKNRLAAVGQLAAGVAHEIRNPLSGISGFVELLQRKLADHGDVARLTGKIQTEIRHLNRIVNDFLTFAAAHPLQPGPVELGDLCRTGVALGEPHAREAGVTLAVAAGEPLTIVADGEQLGQALLNLLRNAVEASPPGGSVTVSWGEAGMFGAVAVRDRGKGMAPDVRGSIFNPFYTTKKNGTGLGLTITHAIIEKHRGHIRVESEPGAGTTITLLIPRTGGQP